MRYIMFSKHLQKMDVPAAGRAIKELGFDGVELTVRPNGHIKPARVTEDLPHAVDALRDIGLEVPAIVTDIKGKDAPYAQAVCAAAAAVGVTHLRNTAWHYHQFGHIREEVTAAMRNAKELEALGKEYALRFCVHAHSGNTLTAQGGLFWHMVRDTDPRFVAASFDLGHLTVEGGNGGWVQSIDLFQDRVGILAVKSYGWFSEPDTETGGTRWTPKLVPLQQGTVQWKRAIGLLRQVGWDADGKALVSLHSEYEGGGSWRSLETPELLAQTREDFAFLRQQVALAD